MAPCRIRVRQAVDPVRTERSSRVERDRADAASWTATVVRLVDWANEAREKSARLEATAVI